jgi:uncharacterized protein (TIGR03437 family)
VLFAGGAPGYAGVNQINLRVGFEVAPGLGRKLRVRQGEVTSEAVLVHVQ